jgi:L-galactose dehydrogenase/L-glyceraldehyde 3-phosphate reductase
MEHGINYLDTAPAYGSGESEKNLGRVLRTLKPAALVGTKWRLAAADLADVTGAVARSVETSLGRLGLERVDLLHLHNLIGRVGEERPLGVARVLEAVVPAVRRLQEQGKVGFFGVTASGETGALHRALGSGAIDSAQAVFNLLNPTGAYALPVGYPAQDYDRLLALAREQGVGTIGIRVLAGGALSGQVARHPTAIPSVAPIASGPDYATDVARTRALEPLVAQGHAGSLVEAALRFAITGDALSTVLIGCSDLAQLDFAVAAVNKGPLSPAALASLDTIWGQA